MLIKTPLLHQSSSPRVFLTLSLSGYFFGAQRPSEFTFLPRLLRPPPEGAVCIHPIERAPEASVNRASPMLGALLAVSVNQGISASFSPLLSYGWLRTTRFRSIKGPQQLVKPIVLPSLSSSIFFSHALIFPASTSLLNLPVSALLIEEERTLGSFIPFFILGTVFLWALFCALNI